MTNSAKSSQGVRVRCAGVPLLAAYTGKRMKAVPIGRPSPPTLREHGGTSAADATIAPTGPLAALAAECRGAATEAEPGDSPLRLLRTGGKMMEPRFPVNLPHHGDAPVSDVLCHAARIRHCAKREPLDAGDVPRPLTCRAAAPAPTPVMRSAARPLVPGMVASGASIKSGDRSALREYQFITSPGVAYDGCDDFHCFLTEAEILRDFGQRWRPRRAKSDPLLPSDVWRPRQLETADAPA